MTHFLSALQLEAIIDKELKHMPLFCLLPPKLFALLVVPKLYAARHSQGQEKGQRRSLWRPILTQSIKHYRFEPCEILEDLT